MRLTLRTLLAHMDDVLDPADSKDVGEKIEGSEFAASLVRRIRAVTADPKLSAPRLHGRVAGLDSNTVAEYLDNVLPAERVEDFERFCLESDVHLSEVASCHQTLALVLGEPAEVPDAARQRMRGLLTAYEKGQLDKSAANNRGSDGAGDAGQGPAATSAAKSATARHHGARRHTVEVPEYLKESPSTARFWKALAVILLAGLLGLAMIMAFGGFQIFDRGEDAVADKDSPPSNPAKSGEGEQSAVDETSAEPDDGSAEAPDNPAHGGDNVPVGPMDDDGAAQGNDQPAAPGPPGDDPTQALPDDPPVPVMPPGEGTEGQNTNEPSDNVAEPQEPSESDQPLADPTGNAGGAPEATAPDATSPEATSDPENPAKVLPPLPMPGGKAAVGKYTLPGSVLFRRGADEGEWSRMPALGTLQAGDRLITPPTSRSQVTLDGGVILDMLGDTSVVLSAPETPGAPPIVEIAYGRLIVADAREPLVMQAGGEAFEISFNDAASGAAVEVQPFRTPGSSPIDAASRLQVDVYAFKGTTMLQHAGDAQPAVLAAPARRTLGLDAPAGDAVLPEWLSKQSLTSAERLAHASMEEGLRGEAGSMLLGGLLELADDRPRKRNEVRTLACRALMSIGRFDSTIAALGNSEFRASWPVLIESLKRHVARDSATAAAVLEALNMRYGEIRGAELFRMLWGYSDEDLKGGEAEKLVAYLDHAELEFRVLGSWNLRDVTGVGNVFYRPDSPPVQRKQYVRQWQQRLESGQIVNKKAE